MGKLDGKVAIVTGGVAGIGLAACKLFVQEGAKVLMVDLSEDALAKQVEQLGESDISYFPADVSKEDQTKDYVQAAVDRYGGVDVYVANAGILGPVAPITDYPIDMFDRVFEVNVRGTWLGIKYVLPYLQQKNEGSIILTSSIAGIKGFPYVSVYSGTKHALKGIMRSVAIECADTAIRVNTVHPGATQTHMIEELEEGFGAGDPEVGREALLGGTLMGRYASPEEVAKMMLFIASDGSYCTGSVFMVDGGMATK